MYKNLADVSLDQWQRIYDVLKTPSADPASEFERSLSVVGILHGISTDELSNMTTDEVKELLPTLNIISQPIRKEFARVITVNGRKYKIIYDPTDLPNENAFKLGQMEFNSPDDIVSNLHKIIALMTSGANQDIAAEDMKCARFGQVYPLFLFSFNTIMALAKKTNPEIKGLLNSLKFN
jgi:hypothetical protein